MSDEKRLHIYVSHSFDHAEKYERLLEFIEEEGLPASNFSVPFWRQIDGDDVEIERAISQRIWQSNRVIVLATDEIHKSPYIDFEIRVARELGKRIIVVFPHGAHGGPIPEVLHGGFERAIGWRRGALGKALRGEYPPDNREFGIAELDGQRLTDFLVEAEEQRVYDLAKAEERLEIIRTVGGALAAVTFIVAGLEALELERLKREFREHGHELLDQGPSFLNTVAGPTAVGAAVGGLVGALLGKSGEAMVVGALCGGLVGVGVGAHRYFHMRIEMLGSLAKVEFEPVLTGGES